MRVGNDGRGDLPPHPQADHQMSKQRGETRPRRAPCVDSVRSEQGGRRKDRHEHPAPYQLARREHISSIASASIFNRVKRSGGDVDIEQGQDLRERLRHSRRPSHSATTRSANQPQRARPTVAELYELRTRIEDLAVRAEEVGNDNHSPFTGEIKEEPLPHGFKMPKYPAMRGRLIHATTWMRSMIRWNSSK